MAFAPGGFDDDAMVFKADAIKGVCYTLVSSATLAILICLLDDGDTNDASPTFLAQNEPVS